MRFLSGKCQGSEYVLDQDVNLVIGRSGDADLLLLEGMVSRKHARIHGHDGELTLEDLNSTNGTFVNGERVQTRKLRQGDRVLIGTSILKLVLTESPLGTVPPRPDPGVLRDDDQTRDRNQMAGDLTELSVPELLEMLSTTRQGAIVELTGPTGAGHITVKGGIVEDASVDALDDDAPAHKCFLRLLGWARGSFALRPYDEPPHKRIQTPIPQLLVDGLFRLDELTVLRQRLPEGNHRLVLAQPLTPPLSALDEADLDVLQLAHNLGLVDDVLDGMSEDDLEVTKRLLRLVDAGYLRRA